MRTPPNPHRRRLLQLGGTALIAGQTGLLTACSPSAGAATGATGAATASATASTQGWAGGGTALIVHHKVQTTGFEPVSFSSNVWAWNTDTVATRYIRLSTTLCG